MSYRFEPFTRIYTRLVLRDLLVLHLLAARYNYTIVPEVNIKSYLFIPYPKVTVSFNSVLKSKDCTIK